MHRRSQHVVALQAKANWRKSAFTVYYPLPQPFLSQAITLHLTGPFDTTPKHRPYRSVRSDQSRSSQVRLPEMPLAALPLAPITLGDAVPLAQRTLGPAL